MARNKKILKKNQHLWYIRNKERILKNQRIRKRERFAWIADIKRQRGCDMCGEREPCCLNYHHIRNKIKNISILVSEIASKERILKEIEKCQLLCSNCHRNTHEHYHRTTLRHAWFTEYKKSLICEDCQEDRTDTLDFHHLIIENKIYGIANMVCRSFSEKRIREEIKKCVILCANCHQKRHKSGSS